MSIAGSVALGPAAITDYHAHLLRLDRMSRWTRFAAAIDDRGIDAHCLRLAAAGAIVTGAFIDGILRGGAEIVAHADGYRADAAFSVEPAWRGHGIGRSLVACALAEARRRGFDDLILDVLEGNEPMLRLAAQNGAVLIDSGRMLSFRIPLRVARACTDEVVREQVDEMLLLRGYV